MIKINKKNFGDGGFGDFAPDFMPMLDILFILLVFFMLTAGAVFQSIKLDLPSAVSDAPVLKEPKNIMLEIRQNSYLLDGSYVTDFQTLKTALPGVVKAKPGHELVIAADRQAPVEKLVRVLTFMQSRGIYSANILMRRKERAK